jgi:hypothetical protein
MKPGRVKEVGQGVQVLRKGAERFGAELSVCVSLDPPAVHVM